MLSSVFASVLALAVSVSALTPANTANPPEGNPIGHPGLGELIPAGKSFTITWTPTTPSTDKISLQLLRGPSTNVVPILTIADSVPNTGSFVWSVPDTLEPDTTHYGVELTVEGTGQYQYSPQCGVSNPGFSGSDDSGVKSNAAGGSITLSSSSSSGSLSAAASTTISGSESAAQTTTSTFAAVTGSAGNFSSPVLTPTGSMTVPSSLLTETSTFSELPGTTDIAETPTAVQTTAAATSSGAAVANRAGGSVAGLAVAGLVAAFL